MTKIQKETLIGFFVGVIANTIGTLLYIILFSDLGIVETYNAAGKTRTHWKSFSTWSRS